MKRASELAHRRRLWASTLGQMIASHGFDRAPTMDEGAFVWTRARGEVRNQFVTRILVPRGGNPYVDCGLMIFHEALVSVADDAFRCSDLPSAAFDLAGRTRTEAFSYRLASDDDIRAAVDHVSRYWDVVEQLCQSLDTIRQVDDLINVAKSDLGFGQTRAMVGTAAVAICRPREFDAVAESFLREIIMSEPYEFVDVFSAGIAKLRIRAHASR